MLWTIGIYSIGWFCFQTFSKNQSAFLAAVRVHRVHSIHNSHSNHG